MTLRTDGDGPFITDNSHVILDLLFAGGIDDPSGLGTEPKQTVGVVEQGLFVGFAQSCIVAFFDGAKVLGAPTSSG